MPADMFESRAFRHVLDGVAELRGPHVSRAAELIDYEAPRIQTVSKVCVVEGVTGCSRQAYVEEASHRPTQLEDVELAHPFERHLRRRDGIRRNLIIVQ